MRTTDFFCNKKDKRCLNLYPKNIDLPQRPTICPIRSAGGEIIVRSTTTLEAGEEARVVSTYEGNKNFLDFYIPKGDEGVCEDIKVGNTYSEDFDQEANVIDRYEEGVHYFDFMIPKGVPGPKGDRGATGPQGEKGEIEALSAYILSYNDDPTTFPVEGLEIPSNKRLPLKRLELDNGGIVTIDTNDMTIQFNKTGVYYVSFTTNAYVKHSGKDFDPETDFVSIAFREIDSDNIIAAGISLSYNECATPLFGQGMFVVADVATAYEFVNTQQRSIYIHGCNVMKTVSHSYFSVPMLSIAIIKLK